MTLNSVCFNRAILALVTAPVFPFLIGCFFIPAAIASPVPLPQTRKYPSLLQQNRPAKTVKEWLAQVEVATVKITSAHSPLPSSTLTL